jgi:GH15 family glucan-1,4-alpha-glucosidase
VSVRIEDYGLIGDCETCALVSRAGSVDWLCWPRFDSDACFAALLGDEGNGRWLIAPTDPGAIVSRRYRGDTLVLETTFETSSGSVVLIDFMPPRRSDSHLVRLVVGKRGQVKMSMQLILRFGLGAAIPWVTRMEDGALRAVAGPDMVVMRTPVPFRGEDKTTVADFSVAEGETTPFVLSYGSSHLPPPRTIDPQAALRSAGRFWRKWCASKTVDGRYGELIRRSLVTVKALTYGPTGGLVAAATASLPEQLGGERNWDYRYCWIRDAALTLLALMKAGHFQEAQAWADWLQRAVAGEPADLQIMYGIGGERRLLEWQADWLAGYAGSRPVRIGNAAHQQFQLDVYGELMEAFHQARQGGLAADGSWAIQQAVVGHVAEVWTRPDQGMWEERGQARHFTVSKVMAWVVMDRAVAAVERFGLKGPADAWRELRKAIRAEVLAKAVNPQTGGFQRAYDDPRADANLLLTAALGFVDAKDPRYVATVAAVERELLTKDGLVLRYDTAQVNDGLPPGEGAFLPCSFWLADAYLRLGRTDEAVALFERLAGLCNDLGLISEEYNAGQGRLVGNFPQAFSHVALLNTALDLTRMREPAAAAAG